MIKYLLSLNDYDLPLGNDATFLSFPTGLSEADGPASGVTHRADRNTRAIPPTFQNNLLS